MRFASKMAMIALACCAACAPAQMQAGPAQPNIPQNLPPPNLLSSADAQPGDVEMHSDGRCLNAKPGDTVHYTLTIEDIANAEAAFADLRLRPRGFPAPHGEGLAVPDYRNLGGGGAGVRDSEHGNMYHFSFRVPQQIYSGVYRGVGLEVTTGTARTAAQVTATGVDVTKHTRDEVRAFCINVVSNYGGTGRPEVTDFHPDAVNSSPKP
jgi:hypothetical protein